MRRQRDIFLFTSSAPTTTLFSSHVDSSRRPVSLLASAVVHAAVIGLVVYGILTAPATINVVNDHFSVRHLDLRTPEQQRSARSKSSAAKNQLAKALRAAKAPAPAALNQAIHAAVGPQTLLQPDLTVQAAATQEIPVPRVLIWTPRKTEVKDIVAPEPAPSTTADTHPSLDAPSPEVNLADLDIATSNTPTPKLPVLSGTTTPVVTLAKSPVQLPPSTTTQQTEQPTPTAVLSLSDLSVQDGPVTLPPVNETVRTSNAGTLLGTADTSLDGQGEGAQKGNGSGDGTDASDSAGPGGPQESAEAGTAPGTHTGNGTGDQATTTQITLPRDGAFGYVVVGQSVEDQFPEMSAVWSGRIAYTVYLHVGLTRSWILQYSLPREVDAAAAGNVNRLEAPWPFSIVRPNLTPGDVNADALMVHGFVDESGHFENLSMVFPQASPEAPFVLKSLEQWQFRPATQNGQVARVEVLLIIPEELE